MAELGLTMYKGLPQTVAKVAYLAMADETRLPVASRDYQRLRVRLEEYRQYVHRGLCPFTRPEGVTCLTCVSTLGVRGTGEVALP